IRRILSDCRIVPIPHRRRSAATRWTMSSFGRSRPAATMKGTAIVLEYMTSTCWSPSGRSRRRGSTSSTGSTFCGGGFFLIEWSSSLIVPRVRLGLSDVWPGGGNGQAGPFAHGRGVAACPIHDVVLVERGHLAAVDDHPAVDDDEGDVGTRRAPGERGGEAGCAHEARPGGARGAGR